MPCITPNVIVTMAESDGFFSVTGRAVYRTFTYDRGDGMGLTRAEQLDRARVYAQGIANGIKSCGFAVTLDINLL